MALQGLQGRQLSLLLLRLRKGLAWLTEVVVAVAWVAGQPFHSVVQGLAQYLQEGQEEVCHDVGPAGVRVRGRVFRPSLATYLHQNRSDGPR